MCVGLGESTGEALSQCSHHTSLMVVASERQCLDFLNMNRGNNRDFFFHFPREIHLQLCRVLILQQSISDSFLPLILPAPPPLLTPSKHLFRTIYAWQAELGAQVSKTKIIALGESPR